MSARLKWLALAVVLVAAFLFLWDLPEQRRQQEREARERQLLSFDPALVDSLRLARADGGVLVVRQADGGWRLREPIEERAVGSSVENFLRQLLGAESWQTLGDMPDSLQGQFGLAGVPSGSARIDIAQRDGVHSSLLVGQRIPRGGGVYVRRPGGRLIEMGEESLYSLAWSPPDAFRSFELFAVADSQIVEVRAKLPSRAWRVRRGEKGLWWFDDGRRMRQFEALNLVHDVAAARIRQYVADHLAPEDWTAYGLQEPALDLRYRTAAGDSGRIRLGNEADESMIFARRNEESTVLTVLPQMLVVPETSLEELVDRNPILENFAELDSLEVRERPGGTVRARRADRDWLVRGVRGDVLQLALRNVALGLERFQPTGTMLVSQPPVEEFLDRIPVAGTLWFHGRARSFRVGWREGESEHWLQLDEEPTLYRVDRDLYLRLHALVMAYEQAGG